MELRGAMNLLTGLILLTSSDSATAKVVTVIDAYTPTSVLASPATVPLGTTVVLVCRVGGVAYGTQLSYTWTCPKQRCNLGPGLGPGGNRWTYEDKMVINVMSPDDSRHYACLVRGPSGEMLSTESFYLNVTGGLYLFSDRRLIAENAMITNMGNINGSQGGVITCYSPPQSGSPMWSGPPGVDLNTTPDLGSEGAVSLAVNQRNFTNGQYCCHGGGDMRCVNVYTSGGGTLLKPRLNALMDATRQLALVATVDTVQSAQRFVTAYARQDLDVSLKVEYIETNVFSQDDYIISKPANTTVSGARYRITVWALNGEAYSAEPFTHTAVLRDDMVPSAPRSLILTRAFLDAYELSWIPPQEPHGAVQYTVKYTDTHNSAEVRINTTGEHYNMTGLVPDATYHVTVAAMNSVGLGAESEAILFTTTQSAINKTPTQFGTGQGPSPTSPNTGVVIISVTLVSSLMLLVGGLATATLLVVLLCVKSRQSRKKTQWGLQRDTSLYSTGDHSYATVYATTEHLDVLREGAARKASGANGVPQDASGGENGYQELMESSVQRNMYAHLYSSLPLHKEELANSRPQGVVDVTETKWTGDDMGGGEGDEQENPYINAAIVAMQVQK